MSVAEWTLMFPDGTPVSPVETLKASERSALVRVGFERVEKDGGSTAEARAEAAEAKLAVALQRIETLKASAPPANKEVAYERIEKAAEQIRGSEPTLTREQAVLRVTREQPELVRQYRDAPAAPATAVRVTKDEPLPGTQFSDALTVRAMAVAKSDSVSFSAAYGRVLATPEGQRLRKMYYAAAHAR